MAKRDSYPNQIKSELAQVPEFVTDTITQLDTLKELAKLGRPKTAAELQERLDNYFNYCKDNSLKPGIESMALACDIDRRTFWTWCQGARGEEIKDICIRARQVLTSFIETSMYYGKINPAAAIFSLKNIAQWQDSVTIETVTQNNNSGTAADLPIWDENGNKIIGELPILNESEE